MDNASDATTLSSVFEEFDGCHLSSSLKERLDKLTWLDLQGTYKDISKLVRDEEDKSRDDDTMDDLHDARGEPDDSGKASWASFINSSRIHLQDSGDKRGREEGAKNSSDSRKHKQHKNGAKNGGRGTPMTSPTRQSQRLEQAQHKPTR